ncbi:NAC domain-containing protein 45-like isoform X2 [Prunus yedoensis var. nudiflora]|uniref:NAC domain-containing protein 45-like isoform X2 n=1 Tax=Prunus yedoensis var. nudiflora TaxID=2094558 RepID=A0A314YGK5_PRUYE|nr:NAC domain-containing protein 45-like isoform X2 [Prunus yedoensis var. nudiflora]
MARLSRAAEEEEGDLSLPVGFRFRPTDEELVNYYLKNKLEGSHAENIIDEIDILKFEPWDLPDKSLIKSDDENWFFFYKYKKGIRATKEGFWKITSKDRVIKARDNRTVIAKKRILTFYIGRVRKSTKTNWVIHEYYIPDDAHPNAKQRDFVLCHLKKNVKKSDENTDVATTCDEGEPSTHNASDFENPPVHGMESLEEDTERTRDLWLANSRSNNDHNAFQSDFEANDPEAEEFASSLLIDPQCDTDTEPIHMRLQGGFTSSPSTRDTEVILHNQLSRPAASPVLVAPQPQTSELQLQSGTSERTQRAQPRSINVLRDTSAVNVDAFNFSINCIQLATDDEYYTKERTRRRTYTPVGKLREIKLQQSKAKEPEERRTSVDLPQKQISVTKSSVDRKVAQGKNAEKDMEQTQNRTTPSNWNGSFITWQTSPLTSPPSVYIFNTVLGAILFYFCVREVVLYGEWR